LTEIVISSPVNEHVTRLDLSRRNGAGLLEQLSGELGPLNALIVNPCEATTSGRFSARSRC